MTNKKILINPFESFDRLQAFLESYNGITGIYSVSFSKEKCCYIGKSTNIKRRLSRHYKYFYTDFQYKKRSSQEFYSLVRKNNADLILEILELFDSRYVGHNETKWQLCYHKLGYKVYGKTNAALQIINGGF